MYNIQYLSDIQKSPTLSGRRFLQGVRLINTRETLWKLLLSLLLFMSGSVLQAEDDSAQNIQNFLS
jgi:hypothetical protein